MAPQQPDGPSGSGGGEGAAAQEPAGEGGIRAAERSAERAAALAATEGFHPLRLRPYVGEPHDEPRSTTVRPLLDTSGDGPDTADLGLFPETYAEFAADGAEYETYEAYDAYEAAIGAEAAAHGRHRRRRRGIVVAAAAVAASALAAGAVAVTGQVMGDEQGATGHALPDLSASVPDVTLPTDAATAPATADTARPVTHRPSAAATTATPSSSATPSHTPAPPVTPTGSITTTAPPSTPPTGAPTPTHHAVQAPQVLRLGDSGPAVADLQRRLTRVWVYDGPIDGVFDTEVQEAVATFQVWYWVSDAPDGSHNGVYGPNTRAALERQSD